MEFDTKEDVAVPDSTTSIELDSDQKSKIRKPTLKLRKLSDLVVVSSDEESDMTLADETLHRRPAPQKQSKYSFGWKKNSEEIVSSEVHPGDGEKLHSESDEQFKQNFQDLWCEAQKINNVQISTDSKTDTQIHISIPPISYNSGSTSAPHSYYPFPEHHPSANVVEDPVAAFEAAMERLDRKKKERQLKERRRASPEAGYRKRKSRYSHERGHKHRRHDYSPLRERSSQSRNRHRSPSCGHSTHNLDSRSPTPKRSNSRSHSSKRSRQERRHKHRRRDYSPHSERSSQSKNRHRSPSRGHSTHNTDSRSPTPKRPNSRSHSPNRSRHERHHKYRRRDYSPLRERSSQSKNHHRSSSSGHSAHNTDLRSLTPKRSNSRSHSSKRSRHERRTHRRRDYSPRHERSPHFKNRHRSTSSGHSTLTHSRSPTPERSNTGDLGDKVNLNSRSPSPKRSRIGDLRDKINPNSRSPSPKRSRIGDLRDKIKPDSRSPSPKRSRIGDLRDRINTGRNRRKNKIVKSRILQAADYSELDDNQSQDLIKSKLTTLTLGSLNSLRTSLLNELLEERLLEQLDEPQSPIQSAESKLESSPSKVSTNVVKENDTLEPSESSSQRPSETDIVSRVRRKESPVKELPVDSHLIEFLIQEKVSKRALPILPIGQYFQLSPLLLEENKTSKYEESVLNQQIGKSPEPNQSSSFRRKDKVNCTLSPLLKLEWQIKKILDVSHSDTHEEASLCEQTDEVFSPILKLDWKLESQEMISSKLSEENTTSDFENTIPCGSESLTSALTLIRDSYKPRESLTSGLTLIRDSYSPINSPENPLSEEFLSSALNPYSPINSPEVPVESLVNPEVPGSLINPNILNCGLCGKTCKRSVVLPCCFAQACNGCAVSAITKNRMCWGCQAPVKTTKELDQDKVLREAIEWFRKNGTIKKEHGESLVMRRQLNIDRNYVEILEDKGEEEPVSEYRSKSQRKNLSETKSLAKKPKSSTDTEEEVSASTRVKRKILEKIERLETDQERLRLAKSEFQNPICSDPTVNLTFHGYRRRKKFVMQDENMDSFYDFYTHPEVVNLGDVKEEKRQKFYLKAGDTVPMPGFKKVFEMAKLKIITLNKKGRAEDNSPQEEIVSAADFKVLLENEFQKNNKPPKKSKGSSKKNNYKTQFSHFRAAHSEAINFLQFYKSQLERRQVEEMVYLENLYKTCTVFYGKTEPIFCKSCNVNHKF